MPGRKLVRDRLADRLRELGFRVERASPGEAVGLLAEKVVEEAIELWENPSVEEMADVLEALRALARALGVEWGEVERLADEKRMEKGGFEGLNTLVLRQESDDPPGNPL